MSRSEIEIAADLFALDRERKKLDEKRLALEQEIVTLLGKREEGSKTHTVGDYKVTITARLNRSIDWEKFDEVSSKIPQSLWPVKRALDETGVKYLANNEPTMYKILSSALTIKEGKTGVSIVMGA